MSLIAFTHGTTVQLKNLKSPWYELVNPGMVQELQTAEIELGSSLVAERTNERILEQIANGSSKLFCGPFKFHHFDRNGCLQHCRVLERLARIELLELDGAVQIQKMWRGRAPRMWWAPYGLKVLFCRNWLAAIKIQKMWRRVMINKGKTPNSWWIKPLQVWNKQVCCPHRSMIWIPENEAGPPL